jgi:hypothetical protein
MGSNSFRLEIGHLRDGRYRRHAYLKETVRLGAGLDSEGMLTDEATERGLACLRQFARNLGGFHPHRCGPWPPRRCARRATATPSCTRRRPRWVSRSRSSPAARKRG